MKQVNAKSLGNEHIFRSPVDISSVDLSWGGLVVALISGGDRKVANVKFADIVGFRYLDEGDLLEFWPICSSDNGWLFQIEENGWFDLEATRPGFLRGKGQGVFEYFIASQNGCISVLSSEAPVVSVFSI